MTAQHKDTRRLKKAARAAHRPLREIARALREAGDTHALAWWSRKRSDSGVSRGRVELPRLKYTPASYGAGRGR